MSSEPEAVIDGALSHLPARLPNSPDFRQGYQLGISDRAWAEHLAARDRAPQQAAPAKPQTSSWGVMAGDLRGRLSVGDTVVRDLAHLGENSYLTQSPCCGRKITVLRVPEAAAIVCCRCRIAATVTLMQEEPDWDDEPPHVALFTVTSTTVVIAQHRAGRWER